MAILSQLAENKQLQHSAKSITKGDSLHFDLFQHSLLKIYDLGEERVLQIESIEGYMNIVMWRQWTDITSDFNRTHRPQNKYEHFQPEDQTSTFASKEDQELCLTFFETVTPEHIKVSKELQRQAEEYKQNKRFNLTEALVKFYILCNGNVAEISRKMGIPRHALYYQFEQTFKTIRENTSDK